MTLKNFKYCIEVNNVSKIYNSKKNRLLGGSGPWKLIFKLLFSTKVGSKNCPNQFAAVENISIKVEKSHSLGIIGLNGSGKSTLMQILAGTLRPTSGNVNVNGKVVALLELGSGFNPDFSGKENVLINGKLFGLSDSDLKNKMQSIENFAEIGNFFNQPVRTYSSGMVLRLAFAVIVHVKPEILIIDEAFAVGDARFQLKCADYIEKFKQSGGTLLLVSHDLNSVAKFCEESILLHEGKLIYQGKSIDVINYYSKVISENSSNIFGNTKHEIQNTLESVKNEEVSDLPKNISYGGNLGEIKSVLIDNSKTALIQSGKEFTVSVHALAKSIIEDPIFAIRIRNSRGEEVYGTNTKYLKINLEKMFEHDEYKVVFTQNANLGAGKYFVSIGFTCYKSNELCVVHRLRECLGFEVFNKNEFFGSSNCFGQITIDKT